MSEGGTPDEAPKGIKNVERLSSEEISVRERLSHPAKTQEAADILIRDKNIIRIEIPKPVEEEVIAKIEAIKDPLRQTAAIACLALSQAPLVEDKFGPNHDARAAWEQDLTGSSGSESEDPELVNALNYIFNSRLSNNAFAAGVSNVYAYLSMEVFQIDLIEEDKGILNLLKDRINDRNSRWSDLDIDGKVLLVNDLAAFMKNEVLPAVIRGQK